MEVGDSNRHRTALPPIGVFGAEVERHQKYPSISALSISAAPFVSPSTASLSGPTTSYSYPSSATSSGPPQASGYVSPQDSRPTVEDEKDQPTLRQSLPSIHEALSDKPISFAVSTSTGPPPPAPPVPTPQPPQSQQASPPSMPPTRSFLGGPQGPPNPFAQLSTSVPPPYHDQPYPQPLNPPNNHHTPPEAQRSSSFSAINAADSRPRALQTYLPRSPMASSSSSFPAIPNRSPKTANGYVPTSATSPTTYSFRSPYPYSAQSSTQSSTFAHTDDQSRQLSSSWKVDDAKKPSSRLVSSQGHSESVKRHLDIYESEMALNDVLDGSSRVFEFSRTFSQRSHQNQRSEFSLNTLPSLPEVDEMLKQAERMHGGLARIRDSVVTQQQALADQQARAYHGKMYEDEMNGYHEDFKGGFAGSDPKKRRGKAAPPGRCHSCNRAETPEWRRGPDGARTLCNACGLHYAKLTRKVGVNKASTMGGSNLRPKNMDMQ